MTVISKCALQAKYAENAQTTQYTVTGTNKRAIIDKFSIYSPAGGTLTVNLVASGGAAAATNILLVKTLAANETYTCPELVGQGLGEGDFISTLAGAATTVVLRITVREIT